MRPRRTPKKDRRTPTQRLNELERLETEDWANDIRRRERRQTKEYKDRVELAKKFAGRNGHGKRS